MGHSTRSPRGTRWALPKRLIQRSIFRLGYKVQRLNPEERSAFVQFHRPDKAAIDTVFGSDASRLKELRGRYARVQSPAAVHSIWTNRKASDNLTDIGLAGVDLARFRASSSYVWNYYGDSTCDLARLQYYVFAQAVKSGDSAGLLEVLEEDGAFGCATYEFEDVGRVSRDLLDSVAEINFLHRHLGVLDRGDLRVLDIGAGYGRLAHRMLDANPRLVNYTCVDAVPESTFLCEYYMKFRGLQDRTDVIALDEVDERLAGERFDLAINVHGFSECTYGAIEWWLQRVRRSGVTHMMIVPNEEDRFLSTEIDGSRRDYRALLTTLGYEAVVSEPLFDSTVRSLLGVADMMFLFRLRGVPEVTGEPPCSGSTPAG